MKIIERTRIRFISHLFFAVAVLKVPISSQGKDGCYEKFQAMLIALFQYKLMTLFRKLNRDTLNKPLLI